MDEASKLFFEISTTRWINPSDCVDMDCDGRRQVLFRDLDGSVIGSVGSAAISMAEYEWDGDPRFGLGKIFLFLNGLSNMNQYENSSPYIDRIPIKP